MTWIISKLAIQGIKGVLDRSGDFELSKGKKPLSIVIFAPNACGKSGYADAVEYLFSEDGGVDHLGKGGADSEKGGKHALQHILAVEKGIDSKISIQLHNPDTNEKLEIDRPLITGRSDLRPEPLNNIVNLAPAHRILRQHDLRRFVVDYSPSEKYSELSRWIGLTKLETILKHLGTTSRVLESTDLQREVDERVQDIKKATGDQIEEYDSQKIFQWCSNQSNKYLSKQIHITKWDEISTTLPNELNKVKENLLLTSGAAEAYKAKQTQEILLPSFIGENNIFSSSNSAFLSLITAKDNVNKAGLCAKESVFNEIWSSARKILEKQPIEQCPVCGTNWDQTRVGSQSAAIVHLKNSLASLSEFKLAEQKYEDTKNKVIEQLQKIITKFQEIKTYFLALKINEFDQDLVKIETDLKLILSFGKQPDDLYEDFKLCTPKIEKFFKLLQSKLGTLEIKGVPSEIQEIENLLSNLNLLSNCH